MTVTGCVLVYDEVNAFVHANWRQYWNVGNKCSELSTAHLGGVNFHSFICRESVPISGRKHFAYRAFLWLKSLTVWSFGLYRESRFLGDIDHRDTAFDAEYW